MRAGKDEKRGVAPGRSAMSVTSQQRHMSDGLKELLGKTLVPDTVEKQGFRSFTVSATTLWQKPFVDHLSNYLLPT